jgi:hypothetical protein
MKPLTPRPRPHGLEQIRRDAERPQLWSPSRRMERAHEGDLDRGMPVFC